MGPLKSFRLKTDTSRRVMSLLFSDKQVLSPSEAAEDDTALFSGYVFVAHADEVIMFDVHSCKPVKSFEIPFQVQDGPVVVTSTVLSKGMNSL